MSEGYHPEKSKVSADKLSDFVRLQLSGDLKEVPGIGPKTEEALKAAGISTTFGLIGKYLTLKEEGVGPVEHTDRFYYWLKSVVPPSAGQFRAGIVRSICEKVNLTFPGLYEEDAYNTEA
mmetsp:Transcript_1865/g.1675  ORF Transcript_1865/g.1675 Transcript_1865/m.1675 type:complete len:120 (-) Transcript_1865:81-440(-)|eukprot:CAMPEP_0196761938 /NCGR_PEP_ID=MMETSP1095-20130614/1253_1 /TAXON_ID=96789 ORGANISM="Chromulina nebulosa, Strain UTEXLB2642" /NCGR_SAMPLE_ID=MMETSP1095 /ASSEMBLY_ACC=CAM_ASM_000446 /LENGTH=119 /DNA_ID=CAMNT_0042112055 /DNA_START=34 /DNA_END=393 /DNA_ORIENTATION=-